MTKFEKLAEVKFNGNKYAAMDYILTFCTPEANETLYLSFTQNEKELYKSVVKEHLKKAGGLGFIKDQAVLAQELNIEPEELKTMEKNPFKARALKDGLKLVLANSALIVANLVGMGNVAQTGIEMAIGGMTIYISTHLAEQLIDYFKFKKVKKMYNSEEYKDLMEALEKNPPKIGTVSVEELYAENSEVKQL